jgi:phosphoglycolate phosphatase-like HAD superfamily hydrolase
MDSQSENIISAGTETPITSDTTLFDDTTQNVRVVDFDGDSFKNAKQTLSRMLHISEAEINAIEEHLRNKIIENGERFAIKYDDLNNVYEKFKVEYEQRFHDLEAEFVQCQSKLESESKDAYLYRTKYNEAGKRIVHSF